MKWYQVLVGCFLVIQIAFLGYMVYFFMPKQAYDIRVEQVGEYPYTKRGGEKVQTILDDAIAATRQLQETSTYDSPKTPDEVMQSNHVDYILMLVENSREKVVFRIFGRRNIYDANNLASAYSLSKTAYAS